MGNAFIEVRHNIEVAHRLYELEGKCENIHGHSMWVTLRLYGGVNPKGVLEGLTFGDIKKEFRAFLDGTFDHHLLLNEDDPWANDIGWYNNKPEGAAPIIEGPHKLPGLMAVPGDPTTENLARWISEWAAQQWILDNFVTVDETHVNSAGWRSRMQALQEGVE